MIELVDFIYNEEERKVWLDKTDGNGDIYGFDLNLLLETERDVVLEAFEIIKINAKNIYRHFKKDKIKKEGNIKNPEEKKEEKSKRFEI